MWFILALVSLWMALLVSVVVVLTMRRQRAYRLFLSMDAARPAQSIHPLEIHELPTRHSHHQPIALMIRADESTGGGHGDLLRGSQART